MSDKGVPEPGLPDDRRIADVPERPDAASGPRIGTDEWVARVEGRRDQYAGLTAPIRRLWDTLPPAARLAVFVVPFAFLPLLTNSGNVFRYGISTLLYALLALGLNVVIGYAGLLDLGYIAFYGFGAYLYAILASSQFDLHWPSEVVIPLVIVASALLGLLLGLPSRRLLGDYLAIVTLCFGQAFVDFVTNANRIDFPFAGVVDLTGGPNGVANVDPLNFFGIHLRTYTHYFYFSLAVLVLVIAMLHFLNESRTGRAWRALREDPLAAELMSIPVNRLKLLAFAFGAATAGLTGTIFAAVQTGAFPGNFDVALLITIYAVVILGGAGSIAGVLIGAVIINVLPEILRTPEHARLLFYGAIALALVTRVRPWRRLAAVIPAIVAFGIAVHELAGAVWPRLTAGAGEGGGRLADAMEAWVLLPSNPQRIGNYGFVALIVGIILITQLRGLWRTIALVPVIYLAACVWETRLSAEPSVTRLILLGSALIVLMNARPQGLLGTSRVEIV